MEDNVKIKATKKGKRPNKSKNIEDEKDETENVEKETKEQKKRVSKKKSKSQKLVKNEENLEPKEDKISETETHQKISKKSRKKSKANKEKQVREKIEQEHQENAQTSKKAKRTKKKKAKNSEVDKKKVNDEKIDDLEAEKKEKGGNEEDEMKDENETKVSKKQRHKKPKIEIVNHKAPKIHQKISKWPEKALQLEELGTPKKEDKESDGLNEKSDNNENHVNENKSIKDNENDSKNDENGDQKIIETPKHDYNDFESKLDQINPSLEFDDVGFPKVIDENEQIKSKENKLRKKELGKTPEKEEKWKIMVENNDWKKLDERVMKGIPNTYRGIVYKYILDPELLDEQAFDKKQNLDDIIPNLTEEEWKVKYPCWKTIHDDVTRTMPENKMFKDKETLKSLQRVLRAYSVFDEELGFTQGMSFLAAVLLLYMDEKSAYYCYKSLMHGEKHMMRSLYLNGFPQLYKIKELWNVLLRQRYKKVAANMEQVDFVVYGAEWFLSAFLTFSFDPQIKLRIYDRFVAFGTRALLSFALVIISRHKDILANASFEDIVITLHSCDKTEKMKEWGYVLMKYDKLWLEEKDYLALFKATGLEYFP